MKSAAATLPETSELSVFDLRRQARRRAWICPGAGFAALGRPLAAAITYYSSVATLLAAIALAWSPSREMLTVLFALLVVSIAAWVIELGATFYAWPAERLVPARYALKTAVIVVLVVAFTAIVVMSYRVLEVGGSGMSPTLHQGERLLYRRGAKTSQLVRGAPILFRLHADNKFTEAGTLVIARILAVPGDLMQIRDQMYYVFPGGGEEGKPVHPVATADPYPKAIVVVGPPGKMLVPKDRYFVIQDSLEGGLDSRVLSFAHRDDILSADFYTLNSFPPMKKIE